MHAARAKRLPAVLMVTERGIAGGVSHDCVDVAANGLADTGRDRQ